MKVRDIEFNEGFIMVMDKMVRLKLEGASIASEVFSSNDNKYCIQRSNTVNGLLKERDRTNSPIDFLAVIGHDNKLFKWRRSNVDACFNFGMEKILFNLRPGLHHFDGYTAEVTIDELLDIIITEYSEYNISKFEHDNTLYVLLEKS